MDLRADCQGSVLDPATRHTALVRLTSVSVSFLGTQWHLPGRSIVRIDVKDVDCYLAHD